MTGIEVVSEIYKMLNVPAVTSLLGGGKVWQHNRPVNSPFPDVVISLPVFDGNSRSISFVDVNIHTPNLREFWPIAGRNEDHTFPDLEKHNAILNAVLPRIVSGIGFSLEPAILGVPIRDEDGQWFTNVRVSLTTINQNRSLPAVAVELTTATDGFGGCFAVAHEVWSGFVEVLKLSEEDQVEDFSGRLDLIRRVTLRVPADAYTPQKNHQIHTTEGVYVIRGIFPEGASFWKLLTTRKDGETKRTT